MTRYRRLGASDPDLNLIHASWEQSLRRAVEQLPEIEFDEPSRSPSRSRPVAARSTGSADRSGSTVA